MDIRTNFAHRLKHLREKRGLSQAELANNIGISRGSISFYENGDRTADIETLYKLSRYFNVHSDYMLGLTDETIINEYFDELNNSKIKINSHALDLYSKINNLFFEIHTLYYNMYGLENDGERDSYIPRMTQLIYSQISDIVGCYTDVIDEMFYRCDKDVVTKFLQNTKNPMFFDNEILLEVLNICELL